MKKTLRVFLAALFLTTLVLPMTGCDSNDGPLEEAGEKVDDAVDDLTDG